MSRHLVGEMCLHMMLCLQEVHDGTVQMKNLTKQWYQEVRAAPSESDEEVVEYEL